MRFVRRIQRLEERLSEASIAKKKLFPEWLIESLAEKGVPCDESGMPDSAAVERVRAKQEQWGDGPRNPESQPE